MADKPEKKKTEDAVNAEGQSPEVEAAASPPVEADAPEAAEAPEAEVPAAAEAPEAEVPEETAPEAEVPEAEVPEAETPEAEAPEAEVPAAEAPEADAPEATEPAEGESGDAAPEDVEAAAPAADPVVQLAPKERRRKARSEHKGEVRPARSPEERHAERQAVRRNKAVRRRARRLQERAKAAERRAAAPAREPLPPVHAPVEGKPRERQGVVVSDKAEKTITVRIDVARRHRRYEKIVRSSSTLHAHDENNDAHEGDVVRVIESRPLSRTKRWALVDVLERAR
jgi:small subunit ribosomal protein S17